MTDSASPNSGHPDQGSDARPDRDVRAGADLGTSRRAAESETDSDTDSETDSDTETDAETDADQEADTEADTEARSLHSSDPDIDLLGLGESKKREDALRREWGGDRTTAASRLSGAKGNEELRILLRMTALGFQFIGEIAAAVMIGYGIDWWRGTFPFWTSIFSIGGIIIALITLVRAALRMNRILERESNARRPKSDN